MESCVNFILQSPKKDEDTTELLECKKGVEVEKRTAELYGENKRKHRNHEFVIIDELMQCEKWSRTQ